MPSKRRKFQAFPSDRVWAALEASRGNSSKPWGEVLEDLILGDTQGDTQGEAPGDTHPDLLDRLEAIERRLDALEKPGESPNKKPRVIPRNHLVSPKPNPRESPRSHRESPVESPKVTPGDTQGITQVELCQRFGFSAPNIADRAKRAGFEKLGKNGKVAGDSVAFLAAQTGWEKRDGRWHPPTEGQDNGLS